MHDACQMSGLSANNGQTSVGVCHFGAGRGGRKDATVSCHHRLSEDAKFLSSPMTVLVSVHQCQMPGHGFEKVSFERVDVAFWDAMFDSLDSMPHPTGHHHDPSDETIAGPML